MKFFDTKPKRYFAGYLLSLCFIFIIFVIDDKRRHSVDSLIWYFYYYFWSKFTPAAILAIFCAPLGASIVSIITKKQD